MEEEFGEHVEITCDDCSGTGQDYEGDIVVGDCPTCGGQGTIHL